MKDHERGQCINETTCAYMVKWPAKDPDQNIREEVGMKKYPRSNFRIEEIQAAPKHQ